MNQTQTDTTTSAKKKAIVALEEAMLLWELGHLSDQDLTTTFAVAGESFLAERRAQRQREI